MESGIRSLTSTDIRTTTTTKTEMIGAVGVTSNGRRYRYAKAGASNLVAGNLLVNADLDTNVTNKTVATTVAAGATQVVVNVSGAVTADAYADGYLTINDATGEGITYQVTGNTAASGSGTIIVNLAEPLQVGLTTSTSEYTLVKSPWDSVVISATDQADMAVGVSNTAVTAGSYFWCQTRGTCAVLADEAVTRGLALTIGTGTAGAVEALDAAGEPQIGVASEALVDTENRAVFLQID